MSSSSSSSSKAANSSAHAGHDALIPIDPDFADLDGHVRVAVGDLIRNRYRVRAVAGTGTFGTVLECVDVKRSQIVAIKAVRSVPRYAQAGYVGARNGVLFLCNHCAQTRDRSHSDCARGPPTTHIISLFLFISATAALSLSLSFFL